MKCKDTIISAAIYPTENHDKKCEKWKEYLDLLSEYNVKEIFSTIHLPELSVKKQLDSLLTLSKLLKNYSFNLCIDIGGESIDYLIENSEYRDIFTMCNVDSIRLDYGFSLEKLQSFQRLFNIREIVLNASLIVENELVEILDFANLNDYRVVLCHNFYPRVETGLDFEFAENQYQLGRKYNLRVMGCIPSLTHPRGPIFKGLVTLEENRYMNLERILLSTNQVVFDSYMIADEFISPYELKIIEEVLIVKIVKVPINLYNIKIEEKNIIDKTHEFRYDSNNRVIRSRTSREMAEFSEIIPENNAIKRKKGSVTIDNVISRRYSGELQIVMSDLPKCPSVNVVGIIDESHLWKFDNYRCGYKYLLIYDNI